MNLLSIATYLKYPPSSRRAASRQQLSSIFHFFRAKKLWFHITALICFLSDCDGRNFTINIFLATSGKKKSKSSSQKSISFGVTVYLSVWHSTFETHNHKPKIYSQGLGSTSVSLVFVLQLPTGRFRKQRYESCTAHMFVPVTFSLVQEAEDAVICFIKREGVRALTDIRMSVLGSLIKMTLLEATEYS